MKSNIMVAMATISALSLAGCNGGSSTVDPSKVADAAAKIASVQKVAMQLCGFLPYATYVAKVFASNVSGLDTAEAFGKAICDAMTATKTSKSATMPKVGGEPVDGEFVMPEGK